jgi:hypothetical protein
MARYGVPPVGKKVYVRVNQFVDGWEDLPVTFSAIVPASASHPPGRAGRRAMARPRGFHAGRRLPGRLPAL